MSSPTLPWYGTFVSAGLGACIAEIATLPIDTAKVRLQLHKKSTGSGSNLGMVGMVLRIAKEEGPLALYKGFWPAIHRQLVFASLRVGLYGQVSIFRGQKCAASGDLTSTSVNVEDYWAIQEGRTEYSAYGLKNRCWSHCGCDRYHHCECEFLSLHLEPRLYVCNIRYVTQYSLPTSLKFDSKPRVFHCPGRGLATVVS